jgi:hypothetical protein
MKRLRHIVTNWLTRNLLKAVTADEVLILSGREWLIGNRKLGAGEIVDLKEEAKSFKSSELYKLIKKEIKYHATLQRFDHAKVADDMLFGKSMLFNLDLIDRFIKNIADL